MANTFAQLSEDVANVGGLDYGSESAISDRWAKGGLRLINRHGAWEWLHAHTSFSFTAGTYNYAFSSIASSLFRVDTRSIRYGDATQYLKWGDIQAIDQLLGPDWKDAGATQGTPEYVTRVGGELWVARIPNTAFVDDHPTASFYYWRTEAFSGNLYLPDDFYEIAIDAALAFGFTEEDDPRGDRLMERFMKIYLPEMRATKLDIGQRDQMALPRHFLVDEAILDDYGDGWVRAQ